MILINKSDDNSVILICTIHWKSIDLISSPMELQNQWKWCYFESNIIESYGKEKKNNTFIL